MPTRKQISIRNTEDPKDLLDCHTSVHRKNEGLPPKEIRMRICLCGLSVTALALQLRRSPYFLHLVINRERRRDAVESAIARLLAWQGYTRSDVWGRIRDPTNNSEDS